MACKITDYSNLFVYKHTDLIRTCKFQTAALRDYEVEKLEDVHAVPDYERGVVVET